MAAPVRDRLRGSALAGTPIPGAGSPWLAQRLGGQPREIPVVAGGAHAVYLRDAGGCFAVLDRHAVAVPIGLRTDLTAVPKVRSAVVGGGRVRMGPLTLELVRVVSVTCPPLPGLRAHGTATRSWLTTGLDPRLDAAHRQLPASALAALSGGDPCALLGRGGGFTPVGDDVICGWLVARHALGLDNHMTLPLRRTTAVSSTLLLRSSSGEAVPQLIDLLVAVASGVDREQVLSQLDDLLQVGSSSGAGLAIGAALAVRSGEAAA